VIAQLNILFGARLCRRPAAAIPTARSTPKNSMRLEVRTFLRLVPCHPHTAALRFNSRANAEEVARRLQELKW
jgi:hypothetical protein